MALEILIAIGVVWTRVACADVFQSSTLSRTSRGTTGADETHSVLSNFPGMLSTVDNERCKTHLVEVVKALENGDSWAIEMLDASSKIPSGLITGNGYQFGNYDECIAVRSPDVGIKGKYCLANVELATFENENKTFSGKKFRSDYDNYESVFEKLKETDDFTKKKRNFFNSGLCVPDSCPAKDVETFLKELLRSTMDDYHKNVRVTVSEVNCSTGDGKTLSKEAKVLGFFILALFWWVLFCTAWDGMRNSKNEGKFHFCLEAFSLSRNISKFLDEKPESDTNVFNGMKCLSMILVIMGHRGMASLGGPLMNPQFFEEVSLNTESLCMFQSWYVTCDMHFTLLAPVVVQLVAKSPRKGLIFLLLLTVGSVLASFVIVYFLVHGAVQLYTTSTLRAPEHMNFPKLVGGCARLSNS